MPDLFEVFRARPDRSAILTDFDGTLSAIVEDWNAAVPLPGARNVLESLADRYAMVGVVSGRPVSYLERHLGTRLRLSGLYGLEDIIDGERTSIEDDERWRSLVHDAVESASVQFGALVEDKGLSVTVHFRTRPDLERDIRAWAGREHERAGLQLRSAKESVELHPPIAVDKGSVVTTAIGTLDNACFLGDDLGDLTAFDALDRARTRGVHAVKVGVRTEETPAVLLDRADVVVDGPLGALALLASL